MKMDRFHGWRLSLKPLHLGLVSSIILILAAYRVVTYYHFSHIGLVWAVFGMGIGQVFLQLVFFFHLGLESGRHWYLVTFLFTLLIMIIVIGGSIWIMKNLSYNMMINH